MNFEDLRDDVGEWSYEQFGEQEPWYCLKGAYEEYGELLHSDLKQDQEIRLDEEGVGEAAERDAVGDIVIYLMDFAYRGGYEVPTLVPTETEDKEDALREVSIWLGEITRSHPAEMTSDVDVALTGVVSNLSSYCEHKGYDFERCVSDAWHEEVKVREW